MVEVLERDTVGETIDATVNYIVNNGQKLFTETAGPGGTDVRTGGTVDPRRVPIHNARLHSDPFVLDREGFRFVRHDTKSPTSTTRLKSGASIIRRWKR